MFIQGKGRGIAGVDLITVENRELIPGTNIIGNMGVYRPDDPDFEGYGGIMLAYMPRDSVFPFHKHENISTAMGSFHGALEVVLLDAREESGTFKTIQRFKLNPEEGSGHSVLVKVPKGVIHGLKSLSDNTLSVDFPYDIYNPEDFIPYEGEHGELKFGDW